MLAVGLVIAARRRSRGAAIAAVVAAAVVAVPVAFVTLHERLLDGFQRFWLDAGEPDLAFLGADREAVPPSPFVSWYGPLGVLIVLAAVVLAVREVRRSALRKAALLFALAPVLYLVVITVGLGYTPFHGRYLMPAVALGAATWGLVLRVRPLAWAAAAIATVTVVLSFVHYVEKPAGFAVLGGGDVRSVWNESRIEVLAHSRAPGGAGPLQVLEEEAADGDTVALQIRQDDVSYPFFGADLDRRVVFVEETGGLDEEADWLVVAPGLTPDVCDPGLALAARRRVRLAPLRARGSLPWRNSGALSSGVPGYDGGVTVTTVPVWALPPSSTPALSSTTLMAKVRMMNATADAIAIFQPRVISYLPFSPGRRARSQCISLPATGCSCSRRTGRAGRRKSPPSTGRQRSGIRCHRTP